MHDRSERILLIASAVVGIGWTVVVVCLIVAEVLR
jgi:hypothetical protein